MTREIGVLGCGTIGQELADAIASEEIPAVELRSVYDRNPKRVTTLVESIDSTSVMAADSVATMSDQVDLIVEAASSSAVEAYAVDVISSGTDLMILSAGALHDDELRTGLISATQTNQSRLYVPSGAIAGLDAIKAAAARDGLDEVTITTTKPPQGLEGAPYIADTNIDLTSITAKEVIFEGTARDAVQAFPANVNVSLALSLAGIGVDDTTVRIVAAPNQENNMHSIRATGSAGTIKTTVENVPSPSNPKTSYLAIMSAMVKIDDISGSMSVGT